MKFAAIADSVSYVCQSFGLNGHFELSHAVVNNAKLDIRLKRRYLVYSAWFPDCAGRKIGIRTFASL